MLRIGKILFPTDFSNCANQALPHALYLAEKYNAELHMLHGIVLHNDDPYNPDLHFPNVEDVFNKLRENSDVQMTTNIKTHNVKDITIIKVQERAISSTELILNYSKEHDIDVIVLGTHGRRGIGHTFLGSVAEEVVRMASCPVLTVREQENPIPIENIENILVPVDYSEHSKKALTYAKEIASIYNAKLDLLHIYEDLVFPQFYNLEENIKRRINEETRVSAIRKIEEMIQEIKGPDSEYDTHIIGGHCAYEILNFAEGKKSDLIVIATHGLTGLKHFLLGSIAEKVVRRAPCPVFTVKAFGKSLV